MGRASGLRPRPSWGGGRCAAPRGALAALAYRQTGFGSGSMRAAAQASGPPHQHARERSDRTRPIRRGVSRRPPHQPRAQPAAPTISLPPFPMETTRADLYDPVALASLGHLEVVARWIVDGF